MSYLLYLGRDLLALLHLHLVRRQNFICRLCLVLLRHGELELEKLRRGSAMSVEALRGC